MVTSTITIGGSNWIKLSDGGTDEFFNHLGKHDLDISTYPFWKKVILGSDGGTSKFDKDKIHILSFNGCGFSPWKTTQLVKSSTLMGTNSGKIDLGGSSTFRTRLKFM